MLIRVFIKRQIKEGKEMESFALVRKLRSVAMEQEGYISGETLVSTEAPRRIMVTSTWQSLENWTSWKESEERKKIDSRLEELQETSTVYDPYVFSKYRISVQKDFKDYSD
jgi:heme-degrading monooxygenase HmoA